MTRFYQFCGGRRYGSPTDVTCRDWCRGVAVGARLGADGRLGDRLAERTGQPSDVWLRFAGWDGHQRWAAWRIEWRGSYHRQFWRRCQPEHDDREECRADGREHVRPGYGGNHRHRGDDRHDTELCLDERGGWGDAVADAE